MKSKQKKYITTIGLIWAACSIVLFFCYVLALAPQGQEKIDVAQALASQMRAYDLAVKAADESVQARLNDQVADMRTKMTDFVIDFGESANITFDISETATEQGINSFSIKSPVGGYTSAGPGLDCISESRFDVNFKGSFRQFARFLNALERHEPVLFVDKFAITRSWQSAVGHDVKLNVSAIVSKQQGN